MLHNVSRDAEVLPALSDVLEVQREAQHRRSTSPQTSVQRYDSRPWYLLWRFGVRRSWLRPCSRLC